MMKFLKQVLCVLALITVLLLTACQEKKQPPLPPRAIKLFTVQSQSERQKNRFSAIVEPSQVTELSFRVPGKIALVEDKLGQTVKKGQLVAALNKYNFYLRIDAAESELTRVKAQLIEAKSRFEAITQLFKNKYVSKIEYKRSESDYQVVLSNIKLMEAKLKLAKDNLKKTELFAPFSGKITNVYVERHQEVAVGQKILKLQGDKSYEVTVNLPESLINSVKLSEEVNIKFVSLPNLRINGLVTEIGAHINLANIYPVVVSFNNPPPSIRAGMTVEVTFTTATTTNTSAIYLIPINAVLPGDEAGKAFVYVYDPATKTVKKTEITAYSVQDNFVQVRTGIRSGEKIAATGVRFLSDGQKVNLIKDSE